ncbi:MAG TPA: NapC/NirT family cytochrome c [Burkholderiaceae bacterium]
MTVSRVGLALLVAGSALLGVILWGGFNTALELTNSMAFCISCHEMKDNVYQEYVKSPHYANASGVRATCPDCHVPREWFPKVVRKIRATNELFHHLRGTIDTPEKFEAKRAELAEHVWATMKANDSHECRNCHSWEAMDLHKQTQRAQEKMEKGRKDGKTCIECHKGVAHKLPPGDD